MKMNHDDRKLQRVVAIMNRAEIDYLDKIGKDSLFTAGVKLSRVKILRAMVEAMKELGIDGKNIKSETDLKNEILKRIAAFGPETQRALRSRKEAHHEDAA
jgi:hypothetical protein